MKSAKYDYIMTEMISNLLVIDFNMVRDYNGDYELPRQHITREELETIASMLYESITVIEIMKLEADNEK